MKRFLLSLPALIIFAIAAMAQDAPKYIFYFIGDGMGNGHVMSTYSYAKDILGREQPLLMTSFPVVAQCTTFSASSPVTDSAAAGTALATGTKTINGMLGVAPDSAAVASVATKLHELGYGIAIVTSVCADDATPGAFYAHVPARKMFYEIGIDAANSDFEFIGGSDLRGVVDSEGRPTDLMSAFEANSVEVVRGVDAMRGVKGRRAVMLNTDTVRNWTLGSTIDSIPGGVTLPEMTSEALRHLERVSPDRFFMMVEGGNIDYAGHSNDGGTAIKEIIKFDEALRVAYDFYLAHPDETLIIVTADHNTGGMTLGNQHLHYDAKLQYIDGQRKSKDLMADEVRAMLRSRRIFTWEDMEEYLRTNLGFWSVVPVTPEQTEMLHKSFNDTFIDGEGREQVTLYNKYPQFVVDVYRVLNDNCGIGWVTNNHVGNSVPVYAIGVGSKDFSGYIDNTYIPTHIYDLVNPAK